MANFFNEIPQLRYHLRHPLMERIVALRERDYSDKDKYDYAPQNFEDAMNSYEQVLEIIGEICGDLIEPNAQNVDQTGPTLENGRAIYDQYTQQNLDAVRRAGLMGIALPRRYDGLNFPITPYIMAADIVSRSDAGFENLWGLQDCATTLYEFGNEDQRQRFLPRVSAGETMSMDLTEPDAGSDLQAVMLKATYNEEEDAWYLNGVKRFITNGDSHIHLVLARSEEGTRDGRGLSMFIFDAKNNPGVTVRRIEHKMGIKGVPTCELVFSNARAELCGERRLGLIKYIMALMNGARLGIMSQAVGISEAAWQEAHAYAIERKQFGKTVDKFPAVYEMLALMRAKTDATRAHLYETCRLVDMSKLLEDISRERKLTPEERQEMKYYTRLADAFTPIGKGLSTEFANQNVYDCVQIHGGSGYMKDYKCERLYRDVRITNIYEGTTQLQIVAAIRHVTTGTYYDRMQEYQKVEVRPELQSLKESMAQMAERARALVDFVTAQKDQELLDFHARRLVEITSHALFAHLLLLSANDEPKLFDKSCRVYHRYALAEQEKIDSYVRNFSASELADYRSEEA
ncbi:Acyl-CoA dehydrogenase C-terminal domain-containing protein [Porphyromonas circumdentaria]|uniref:Acyl-CoA dehydrogenase C-terminal domain-containing protein n=1 Tax=Porphyromonas circumdentaria TaxID=29524 RepID=UPI0026DBA777|nr:Acyl-CoA dehydrogenase C-terminal domain-containing protein [Porphyromonas circumdentaria]MDO4722256.1 Acyl-CoA dehydrogenase C-terminal domain-containing protein [Porphyromonas circumdentaria]